MSSQLDVEKEQLRASIGQHFKALELRTLLSNVGSGDPIAISKVVSKPGLTTAAAPVAAYSIPVLLAPLSRLSMSIDGVRTDATSIRPGDILLVDLQSNPWSQVEEEYSFLRFYISQRTIDALAYERGEKAPSGFRSLVCQQDLVLYELSRALLSWSEIYGPEDSLFADHVALAFHAHIVKTYGHAGEDKPRRGGLAPWQLQRVRELMLANMTGTVSLSELADACGLSVSYFGRAFRQTEGLPPHKWLMTERIGRAKDLLRHSAMSLAEVASACGFADQSHMSRAFARKEGQTPARWRRLSRN